MEPTRGTTTFTIPSIPMPDIPNRQLKVLFVVHLILSTWAAQDQWMPQAYLYYNFVYLALLLWSISKKDSEEPVMMALVVNLGSILLDIIIIPTYYYAYPYRSSHAKFSLAMAIFVLLSRAVAGFLLYNLMKERMEQFGSYGSGGPTIFSGSQKVRTNYEDIDGRQQVPGMAGDVGRSTYSPDSPYNAPP